jgi:hypothetical protein
MLTKATKLLRKKGGTWVPFMLNHVVLRKESALRSYHQAVPRVQLPEI